jgi:CBS domain-containing protein
MRKNTPVRECMSRLPAEADRRDPLREVVRQMREHDCHHVPVMDGAHLYGILSRADLHEIALRDEGHEALAAGDVCTRDVLTFGPMTPIVEVAQAMIDRRVGSALVTDGGMLVGIFTATDALRLIASL